MSIMRIKKFKDMDKETLKTGVDIKSFEQDVDLVGFKSENDEITKSQEKKIKGGIENTTPGLKKSIKKFEDFSLDVQTVYDDGEEDLDEYDPYEYSGFGCCTVCTGKRNCECGCPECNCPPDDEYCDSCDCIPCGCKNNK
jgi:hypothetical protein